MKLVCDLERPPSLSSSISAKTFTSKCFFCNQIVEDDAFDQCQALFMDAHLRMIALELGDMKLFVKPREEDMAAAEGSHHLNCYRKLYNLYRSHENWKASDGNNLEMIYSGWGGGGKKAPYQFFPCNFYKRRD